VYDTLSLQVARHPSESEEYMVARVLAYALEFTDGIGFSRGISGPEEPAIAVRDLTGGIRVWIEIGAPDPSRLHKACKAAPRVVVYTHRNPAQFIAALLGERIHRIDALEIYAIDRPLIGSLAARLDRRMSFAMSVAEREITVSIGSDTLSGTVVRCPIGS
jgi:uncharacterized protein YaeQ